MKEHPEPEPTTLEEEALLAFLQRHRHRILGPRKDDPKTWLE